MALADRDRDDDAMHAGIIGTLRATQVRDQSYDRQTGNFGAPARDFGGIRHIGNNPWRHEAPDLDLPHAGVGECLDPADLGGGLHPGLRHLQPVAGTDFADRDLLSHFRALRWAGRRGLSCVEEEAARTGWCCPRPGASRRAVRASSAGSDGQAGAARLVQRTMIHGKRIAAVLSGQEPGG